jgi:hypothetical protein
MNQTSPADFDQILNVLTTRQHLSPHAPIQQALARLVDDLGVCPQAIDQSLAWLKVDASKSIGRLRRTELMQLARTIHRVWNQRLSDVAATMTS